jgi:ribulose 1,5-bisphosphate carboxylase large subunit-like protein
MSANHFEADVRTTAGPHSHPTGPRSAAELSADELVHVAGGGLLSSPIGTAVGARPASAQGIIAILIGL